jgi:phosphoglycerate dehydrogenase-like enzyme
VIKRLQSFGCRIIVYDPFLSLAEIHDLEVESCEMDTLFELADIVSLHAPLLTTTRGMIGASQLARLHDGAILLNTAHAHLVDEDALLRELLSGRILAALDVFHEEPLPADSPLLALPNVLLSPHAGALTRETLFKQGQMMLDEVQRFLRGEPLAYEIFPDQLPNMA